VGNVVGSNVANMLLVLGIASLVTPLPVSRLFVWRGLILMIGVSVLFWLLSRDGRISPLDGGFLFLGSILYTFYTVMHSRAGTRRQREEKVAQGEPVELPKVGKSIFRQLELIAIGLVLLVIGANFLVGAAVKIAASFGISELVIGLTVVAIGTSLPEIATSLVAGARDERDLAVGNAIGSNLFNILMVIGVSSLILPGGIPISSDVLKFSMPIMIAVAFVCLPIFWADYRIDRSDGALLLGYYAAYSIYLYLDSIDHAYLPRYTDSLIYGVLPLSFAWLAWKLFRAIRQDDGSAG